MKKKISFLLVFVLLLGLLAGCSGSPAGEKETELGQEGSVIFDHEGIKVTTAGLDKDPTSSEEDPIIWIDIENSSDKDVYLGVSGCSVNGVATNAVIIEYLEEDGEIYGANNDFGTTVPAGETINRALGYYKVNMPGVDQDVLSDMVLSFTLAEDESTWRDYISEPVTIKTGQNVEPMDITSLGTTLIDDDKLLLVAGPQNYDSFWGPQVDLYFLNKSDQFIGLYGDTAELDGVYCDFIYYGAAAGPGKIGAAQMSFDGDARELKGFEELLLNLSLYEGADMDALNEAEPTPLDQLTISYPPQIWGYYENGGVKLELPPRINELVTVESPAADPDGIIFSISETESLKAGGYEGAGMLIYLAKLSPEQFHKRLCSDMSGIYVFGKDEEGNYYAAIYPTDVRYERASTQEMEADAEQWRRLVAWAEEYPWQLADENGLESVSVGNSAVEIAAARAAFEEGVNCILEADEYGPVQVGGTDASRYVEFIAKGHFGEADPSETPDCGYIALKFPEEDLEYDFFYDELGYVREISGDVETLYCAGWSDDNIGFADAMTGWYYDLLEDAGLKEPDTEMDAFLGTWFEQIAGRGIVTIERSVAPGAADITITWPNSAAETNIWKLFGMIDDGGRLAYCNGHWEAKEYDEDGNGWTTNVSWEESGYFYFDEEGNFCWHNDLSEGPDDSVFIR